jgi:hypothetical protein
MPTRNELLAEHFLRVAGIAAVFVDDAGAIGTIDVVGIDAPSGWMLLCCAPGNQVAIAAKALEWARLPTPVAAKAGPVPTHERLGPDDCENLQD